MSFAIEWVSDPARFAGLETEWDTLLGADASPFDRHCWYAAFYEAFVAGGEIATVTARRSDGALAAALPLVREGDRLLSAANAHTPSFRPVGADADADAVAAVLAAALDAGAGALELRAVPDESDARSAIDAALAVARWRPAWHPVHRSPFVATDGPLDAWVARTRPKELERLRRKMGRDHDARFSVVEPPSDLHEQLERGMLLESAGWKGRAGTAILSDECTAAFYRRIAAAFHARAELRLTEIELDGELVAFDMLLAGGRRLYQLKNGYDEERRSLKPGRVMLLATVEWSFAQPGVDVMEMLGTDEPYKMEFADGVRPHHELRAFPPTLAGRARHAWWGTVRPELSRLRARR